MPTRKVGSAAFAGALATILIWALNTYLLSVPIEGEIAAAVTTVVAVGIAYLVPDASTTP